MILEHNPPAPRVNTDGAGNDHLGLGPPSERQDVDFQLLAPIVIVPKHSLLTFRPVRPNETASMIYSLLLIGLDAAQMARHWGGNVVVDDIARPV